jgi:hypothetical protein
MSLEIIHVLVNHQIQVIESPETSIEGLVVSPMAGCVSRQKTRARAQLAMAKNAESSEILISLKVETEKLQISLQSIGGKIKPKENCKKGAFAPGEAEKTAKFSVT